MENLKNGEASGRDGVPNEVWKYGERELRNWGWKISNRVWREEEIGRKNGK